MYAVWHDLHGLFVLTLSIIVAFHIVPIFGFLLMAGVLVYGIYDTFG